jgi:hypothetical protein
MTADHITLVETKDRRVVTRARSVSQVLAYTGKLMLLRHPWKKDWLARDIAIRVRGDILALSGTGQTDLRRRKKSVGQRALCGAIS